MSSSPGSRDAGAAGLPIIDSHVHLYPKTHANTLSWSENFHSDHSLNGQNSVDEYRAATASSSGTLAGFIFIEADRKSSVEEEHWHHVLDEVSFLGRIVKGTPGAGEGHGPSDSELVLGIVPWAPIPAGPAVLEPYLLEIQRRCSHVGIDGNIVKGFRYLLQSKPAGTALEIPFIQALHWLGGKGYTFDLGVDSRSGGEHELHEACQMMERVYGGESHEVGSTSASKLKIIINHVCKPNLRLSADEATAGHPALVEWSHYIEKMASYPRTYMKLSGLFSELPPQEADAPAAIDELLTRVKSWVDVVFRAFGPSRIMFGSDWPVCNAGGPGPQKSWSHWRDFVEAILLSHRLNKEDQARVWGGTAAEAYNITGFANSSLQNTH